MSVKVNQGEKFLSLDNPVFKPSKQHSPAGLSSLAADNQEKQNFRSTFEEQRKERDLQIKRSSKESLENKRETTANQLDKLEAKQAQRSRLEEKRNAERLEVDRRSEAAHQIKKENLNAQRREKMEAQGQRGDQGSIKNEQASSASNLPAENSDFEELRDEKVAAPKVESGSKSAAVDDSKTAEAATVDDNSGKALPPAESSEESPEAQPHLADEDKPESMNQQYAVDATASLYALDQEQVAGGEALAKANNLEEPASQRPLTENLVPGDVQGETISDGEALRRVNPDTGVVIENIKTSVEGSGESKVTLDEMAKQQGSASSATTGQQASSVETENAAVQSAQTNLQGELKQDANTENNLKALKDKENLSSVQNQKIFDGNIHGQSSVSVDKNIANENRAANWNGKTEFSHFVNSQTTPVNTTQQQDASIANLRQTYSPDTGRALDVQMKEGDKATLSVVAEKAETTDAANTNKNPIANSRWTQSIEQTQIFNKANSLQTTIPTKFNSEQWANAVADKVLWLSGQRIQSAEIKLDPPELGPMQVRVSVHQDQASIQFVSHHQSVREALDQNVFRLREMFGNEGIDLVDVNVSDHNPQHTMSGEEGSEYHGDGQDTSATDNELTQEDAVLELVNLVDHYV